jgi:hypothetical protein
LFLLSALIFDVFGKSAYIPKQVLLSSGMTFMRKTDKVAPKIAKEIKKAQVNPLTDNTMAAELIRRRRTK